MEDMTNTTVETQETTAEGKNVGAAIVVLGVMAAGAGAGKLIEKGAKKAWNSKAGAWVRGKVSKDKTPEAVASVETVETVVED